MKDIAFCIPAYNRYDCLIELLETIVGQLDDTNRNKIQICVSDDCSPQSLEKTVDYMKQYDVEYIYYRNENNLGADGNFLKSAEIANARYCWMMGDDDGIADGAINRMLRYIEEYPDIAVFFGNRYVCNKKLKPFMKEKWTKRKGHFFVDFTQEDDILKYFNELNSTTCLGYLTTLIVKKQEWDQITEYSEYIGTIYIQVAKYFMMLYKKGKMLCLDDYIALSRFGYDNFYAGMKQRIFMDYYGFMKLTQIFEDFPQIQDSIKGILRRHFNRIFICAMAYGGSISEDERQVMKDIGYSDKDIGIFNKSKLTILFIMACNIIKSAFVDFKWFVKTIFVTIQKLG